MKRMLSLVMAAVLLLGCLTACGQTPAVESASAPAEPVSVTETPAPTQAPAAEPDSTEDSATEPEETENPYEKVSYTLPLFEETAEFSVFYPSRNANLAAMPSHDSGEFPFWARVQENFNVDLTFQEPNQDVCAEQCNLMLASGDYTDLIFESMVNSTGSAYSGGYDQAIEEDIYVNLMDHMEYAPNYAYYVLGNDDNRKVVVTDEGNIGAFMKILSEQQKAVIGPCIHSDYLEKSGLDVPTTIPEWMELFEVMHNNGVKYPCDVSNTGNIQGGDFEDAMGACVSTEFLIDAESGDLVFGPTTAETREYIELFIECMDNGWIDPDWISFTGMENPLFADGSIATCDQIYMQLPTIHERLGFEITPCPVAHRDGYEAGQLAIGELAYPLASAGGGIAITTACDDLEGAMKMIDWMYSDEGAEIINYGWVEGETYVVENGQKHVNSFYNENNEDYGCGNKSLYTNDRDFALTNPNLAYYVAQDMQKDAVDGWTVDTSNAAAIYLRLPDSVRLNSEESSELNTLISDLSTYIQTTMLGWMNKTVAFSDAEWETFCDTCDAMSLGDIQAGYEAAYQRYLDK